MGYNEQGIRQNANRPLVDDKAQECGSQGRMGRDKDGDDSCEADLAEHWLLKCEEQTGGWVGGTG